MLKLVVFDLDGTLVDSRQDLANATNRLIAESGGAPLDVDTVVHMVGEGAGKLIARAFDAAHLAVRPDSLSRFLDLYEEGLAVHTNLYPGVSAMLHRLAAALPIAVLTNKPTRLSERLLEELGIATCIRRVIGGDGPYPRKPDPRGLLALCAGFAAQPREAALVGDSKFDVRTARAAGVPLVLARYGFGFNDVPHEDLSGSEHIVDSAEDVVQWAIRAAGRVPTR